CARWGTPFDYW
nr:immunoglobulin heavy chain junction region [Macaca mulatta]MOX58866.1 immunoglobulin heavy chain junction region [Macaca mulatta]MOX59255.1 immunoglobulin heavy chain junction region [Macaca mulatta]MOX59674.1 immunoglobulin heavy chain junction region [Macaca mulatta]MOX59730.1 immunoglobulin heavy chain junction region [Macaca mulatta]